MNKTGKDLIKLNLSLTSPDLSKGEEKELKNIVWSSKVPPWGDLGGHRIHSKMIKMEENDNYKKPRWLTANKEFYRRYKFDRERLKDNMTPAELILWEQVKNKKLGVKFRRQHIIESYIPDFVALSIKLIIEVDGGIHIKRRKEDAARTKWLNFIGYSVIRFKNEEVENEIEKVLDRIKAEIKILTPPSLSKGEE